MPQSFNIGDIVQLKSGGPKMTVQEFDRSYDVVRCQWFSGSKLENGTFKTDAVSLVSEEKK